MAGISQQINSRVSAKVAEYIKVGVTQVVEMRQLIKIFAKNDLFGSENLPDPRSRVIRSLMYRTMKTLRNSMIDQECLTDKTEKWEREDPSAKFHFRPKCVAEKEPLEKDEISCENENSDNENDNEEIHNENDNEEIRLKGK